MIVGLSWKNATLVGTTDNLTALSGTPTIDGVVLTVGARVLVKNQTSASQNGIYIVASDAWSLAPDFTTATEQNGAAVWVEQGSTQANTGWTMSSTVATVGTDPVTFTQFNGASGITAGVGLQKSGNTLSVQLGAGITELPTGEVGVDLYPTNSGLWLTDNNSSSSTDAAAQLSIRLGDSSLLINSSGLQINTNGVNEHHIATSALTTGLTGGGGSKIGLASAGTAGSYNNVTTDAYGRVVSGSTVSYITQNQAFSITGDATGSYSAGAGSVGLTLATVNSNSGSYGSATQSVSVTVNGKGLITAIGNVTITPAWSSITGTPTTLSGYGITDAQSSNLNLSAIAAFASGTTGWLKKTGASTWALQSLTGNTLSTFGITDAQQISSILSSISTLSQSTTGLIKLSNGVASFDSSTYLTSHPATIPGASSSFYASANTYMSSLIFDQFGHATGYTAATIPDAANVTITPSSGSAGLVALTDSVSTTDSYLAASATAVSSAYSIGALALARSGGSMTGNLILNADPTTALGAATKQYVDNAITGLDFKQAVRVATTVNLTSLAGLPTIDGVSDLAAGQRVLVKNQTAAINNGIYVASASTWSRATDADQNGEVQSGLFVYVEEGTSNNATGWVLSTTGTISLGSTPLTFTQFNGLAGVTAGNGLASSGNTLSVLSQNSANIAVTSGGVDLATIGSAGTFNGVTVDAYGRVTAGTSTAYITQNQAFTATGDVTGSYTAGASSITLSINNAVSAGTGTKVTYNSRGLVTGSTSLSAGDIPNLSWSIITSGKPTTLAGYGITDAQGLNTVLTSITGQSTGTGLLKLTGGIASLDTTTYLSGNQSISVTGDATGSGTTSIALTLANTTVSANSYGSATQTPTFTVDSKGRLTAASSTTITPDWSSITGQPTTIAGYNLTGVVQPYSASLTSISGLSGTAGFVKSNGSGTYSVSAPTTLSGFGITDALNLAGGTLTGALILAADPVTALGAATKQYVDNAITGLEFKESVLAATTADLGTSLSGIPSPIDGVTVIAGSRVLVKNQATASQNGIYTVASGAWTRTADASTLVNGTYCFVEQGTVNGNSGWILSTANPIVTGTTALTFTQFTGLGEIIAGQGLTKSGSTIQVNTASSSRIVINSTNIDLATTTVSANSYGDASNIPSFTVDAYGRITAASTNILSSTNVTEGTKLFYTDARAIAAPLTGYVSGAGTISASDTILQAIQKLNGNVASAVSGGVTSVSVASANGFAGSSSGGTTPTITISTFITGILKGNGTAISAASSSDVLTLIGTGNIGNSYLTNSSVTIGSTSVSLGSTVATFSGVTLVAPVLGTPASGTLTNCTFPTLNQNTTGSAAHLSGSNLSGDVSNSGDAITLATVNSNTGSFGSATSIPVITVNGKGLITAVTTASISGTVTLTGDVSGSGSTGTSISTTLATVTQGSGSSFVKITIDTKGRVTGNTAVAQSDITGLLGSGSITNTMLANNSMTIGSTTISLGSTFTTFAGVTLSSPTFTGTVTGVTPTAGDNSTLVATTAFVTTAISTIDGGSF